MVSLWGPEALEVTECSMRLHFTSTTTLNTAAQCAEPQEVDAKRYGRRLKRAIQGPLHALFFGGLLRFGDEFGPPVVSDVGIVGAKLADHLDLFRHKLLLGSAV